MVPQYLLLNLFPFHRESGRYHNTGRPTSLPQWNIDGQPLQIVKNLRYLGTDFGDLSGTAHCSNRNTASTRAFYGLMRAGIKYPELDSNILVNIFHKVQCRVSHRLVVIQHL